MRNNIPHSRPTIDKNDICSVIDVLRSGNIAQGAKVHEFEKAFLKSQSCKGAVAVNSGTSGLHLSLIALGIKKGDEVIMPSFVCTALLNAVNYVHAKTVIADVNCDDFNISLDSVKKLITKKTKAIIIPHMFGKPADIRPFLKLKIPIIEDCAQAVGAIYGGKKVGNFGVLSVFSFYATKVMTTGEGGMVTSNDLRLLNKIRDLRDYDNKRDYNVRFNYKMTDFQAALGISQLKKLPQMIKQRKQVASFYTKELKGSGLELPLANKGEDHIYSRYVVKSKKDAKKLIQGLNKKGVGVAAPVFKPLHLYLKTGKCPFADKLYAQSVSIPVYPGITKIASKRLIKAIRERIRKI